MQDRYIIPEIMQLATCDFLSAVEEYCEVNKVLPLSVCITWHHMMIPGYVTVWQSAVR